MKTLSERVLWCHWRTCLFSILKWIQLGLWRKYRKSMCGNINYGLFWILYYC